MLSMAHPGKQRDHGSANGAASGNHSGKNTSADPIDPRVLLDIALRSAPDRVVVLVHTHFHLPFGPEAEAGNPEQHARMRAARGIVAASEYSRNYLRNFGGLDSALQRFPVFGKGPFEPSGGAASGCVTMINPCLVKGLPIFLELATLFPEVPFAAVPSWGGDEAVIRELSQLPNMTVLEPADDVGAVLLDTRVLLAPSLVPETFGYVAVDAMLRGIPVLSGHLGGQPEAKLGVDDVLPAVPARRTATSYIAPPQDTTPWRDTLRALLSDGDLYRRCALASRDAALRFLPKPMPSISRAISTRRSHALQSIRTCGCQPSKAPIHEPFLALTE